jgi:AcrR family transcriptional regulator
MAGQKTRSGESGGGLPRLPPGRHGLSREFVVENQKQRIAAGVIAVVAGEGYAATTVSKIVAAAGLSRRTFYNYHSDKEEAFLGAYAEVTDFLLAAMAEAGGSAKGGWAAGVGAQLEALLGCFAANPDLVRFCLVAPPAAGGRVAAAYRSFLERLLEALLGERPGRARKPPPATGYTLIGGLAALIVTASESGGPKALTALLPEATELVLTPYLGREAAVRAAV